MRAKDPYRFSEGSYVRSVWSGMVYKVSKHKNNGMTDMLNLCTGALEKWNSCNNQHFIPADYVSLGVKFILYAN